MAAPAAAESGSSVCVGFRPVDLTCLLRAAVERMNVELDRAAVGMGLCDVRDWLILAALDDGEQCTQLELSRLVCIDKTTLISVLDRLEQQGLVVRTVSPTDRRVRIPQVTASGRRVHAKFATVRDAVEASALEGVSEQDRALLLDLLSRIAVGPDVASATS